MRCLFVNAVVERIAKFPFGGALRRAGAACVENGSRRSENVQHNMGLCCMNGQGEGRWVGYFFFWGRRWASVPWKI